MTNSIPIFLSSDNSYAPFVAVTMASVLNNTKSYVNFFILDGGITEENREKICELKNKFNNFSIEFLKIDFDKYFKNFKETKRITKSMYSRFLIPSLKSEINKAIYSDVDVVCLDNIKKMYDEYLGEYSIGAVFEEYGEGTINNSKKLRTNISKEHKFFSSGNLIIDCKKWRDKNILENLLKINEKYLDNLIEPDMDVLNKYFDCNYKIINPKYCWINQNYKFYGLPKEQIVIRHFNGPVKPWHIHPEIEENPVLDFTLDKNEFWKYAGMTVFYNEILSRVQYKTKADLQKHLVYALLKKKQMQ